MYLSRCVLGPYLAHLEEREAKTLGAEMGAQEKQQELKALGVKLADERREARLKGIRVRDEIIARARKEGQELVAAATLRAERELLQLRDEIARMKQQNSGEILHEAEGLSKLFAAQVLTPVQGRVLH